jgi:hypothetical protein
MDNSIEVAFIAQGYEGDKLTMTPKQQALN